VKRKLLSGKDIVRQQLPPPLGGNFLIALQPAPSQADGSPRALSLGQPDGFPGVDRFDGHRDGLGRDHRRWDALRSIHRGEQLRRIQARRQRSWRQLDALGRSLQSERRHMHLEEIPPRDHRDANRQAHEQRLPCPDHAR
jgi:hypothetical protein